MPKKAFWRSKTVLGLFVVAVNTWVPLYTGEVGSYVQTGMQIFGLLIALYGRWTGNRKLTLRSPDNDRLSHIPISGVLLCLLFFSPQEVYCQDKIKVSVGFSNNEYVFNPIESVEYLQGISAELDAKIFKKSGVRLGGVFRYNRQFNDAISTRFDGPSKCLEGKVCTSTSDIDTYQFGPQLSIDLAKGYVSPFGRALFGVDTTYNNDRTFTRSYGVGVDINLGHVFLRPIVIDWKRSEGLFSASKQSYGAGLGVRF